MSWQDIRQPGEAQHAGDSEEYLGQELGVLCAPLTPLCAGHSGQWLRAKKDKCLGTPCRAASHCYISWTAPESPGRYTSRRIGQGGSGGLLLRREDLA